MSFYFVCPAVRRPEGSTPVGSNGNVIVAVVIVQFDMYLLIQFSSEKGELDADRCLCVSVFVSDALLLLVLVQVLCAQAIPHVVVAVVVLSCALRCPAVVLTSTALLSLSAYLRGQLRSN